MEGWSKENCTYLPIADHCKLHVLSGEQSAVYSNCLCTQYAQQGYALVYQTGCVRSYRVKTFC